MKPAPQPFVRGDSVPTPLASSEKNQAVETHVAESLCTCQVTFAAYPRAFALRYSTVHLTSLPDGVCRMRRHREEIRR